MRYGHDPSRFQDENGVDLAQLRRQLALSVEERLLSLERHHAFAQELFGAANKR